MHHFPLNPFLELIKNDIPICVRDYERISIALQGTGPWSIERLKDVLLALLVKNQDQQNKFLRRFDAFFPVDAETVLNDQEINQVIENIKILIQSKKPPKPPEQKHPKKIIREQKHPTISRLKWWIAGAAVVVITISIIVGLFQYQKPASEIIEPESDLV